MKNISIFLIYGILLVLIPLSQPAAQDKLSFGIEVGILDTKLFEDIDISSFLLTKGMVNYSVKQNIDIEASYLIAEAEGPLPSRGIAIIEINSLDLYGLYYVKPNFFLKGGFHSSTVTRSVRTLTGASSVISNPTSVTDSGFLLGGGIKRGHWRYDATLYSDWFDDDVFTYSVGYLF